MEERLQLHVPVGFIPRNLPSARVVQETRYTTETASTLWEKKILALCEIEPRSLSPEVMRSEDNYGFSLDSNPVLVEYEL
jgi:hypothetical protein